MRDLIPFFDDRHSLSRSMFDEIDRALNSVFGKDFFPTSLTRSSYPKMNVYQDDGKLHIDAYVPEIPKDKISLEVDDGILTLSGSSGKEKEVEKEKYYCREVSKRAFKRSVRLPDNVDLDSIKAEHKDGMLKVTLSLPGEQEEKAKKIDIQ